MAIRCIRIANFIGFLCLASCAKFWVNNGGMSSFQADEYECKRSSSYEKLDGYSTATADENGYRANSRVGTDLTYNEELFQDCMEAKGYRLVSKRQLNSKNESSSSSGTNSRSSPSANSEYHRVLDPVVKPYFDEQSTLYIPLEPEDLPSCLKGVELSTISKDLMTEIVGKRCSVEKKKGIDVAQVIVQARDWRWSADIFNIGTAMCLQNDKVLAFIKDDMERLSGVRPQFKMGPPEDKCYGAADGFVNFSGKFVLGGLTDEVLQKRSGIPLDSKRAMILSSLGCLMASTNGNDAHEACRLAGRVIYAIGLEEGPVSLQSDGRAVLRASCSAGNAKSCGHLN